ncbi:Solute carrier family 46 member 3 [Pteropus alecto]|uniref:Solute carrier family 46 member 3 n=1 Tax=Pteropus alecto TaxID=9402 RepID=L5L5M3_PTEAL|nr:Solute carrier family 46 member 3 [Pteropus alecto]
MKLFFVEPAICLSAFALTLTSPLTTQYVYRRIWEDSGNYSMASASNVSDCDKNKSSPIFAFQEINCVQEARMIQHFFLRPHISSPFLRNKYTYVYVYWNKSKYRNKFVIDLETHVKRTTELFLNYGLPHRIRLPFLFTFVPLSVLRSMMSKVVHSTEIGALFACTAFLETLGGTIAVSTFNGIYSATVAWSPGFVFLLSAALLLIPLASLCVVKCASWDKRGDVLLVQEEASEDTSDS